MKSSSSSSSKGSRNPSLEMRSSHQVIYQAMVAAAAETHKHPLEPDLQQHQLRQDILGTVTMLVLTLHLQTRP